MENIAINLAAQKDLPEIAEVYARAFNAAQVGEQWTPEKARQLMEFLFKAQPDLFLVAESGGKICGGIAGIIKPFWDGAYITDTELFVDPDSQSRGLGKKLLKNLITKAIEKYNIKTFDGLTFKDKQFPLEWYKRIGLKESNFVYLEGDPKEILENLKE